MNSSQILALIKRDLPLRIREALAYKGGDHFAANLKASGAVAREITDWIDAVCDANKDEARMGEEPI